MRARIDFNEWLAARPVRIGDGAMGTMLQDAGLLPGACPELWDIERPDAVAAVIRAYVDAGAEMVETNSFGGSPQKLGAYDLAPRCAEVNRRAAEIACQAAGPEVLVLGSMGPTGRLLRPLGDLAEADASDGFRTQADALAQGGADALCVETMTDLQEAVLAVRAAVITGLPVMATMTFEKTRRGFYTIMGVPVARAAAGLEEAGACVVGANCGAGPDTMVELVAAWRAVTTLPILVQPNAGIPQLQEGRVHYPEGPESFAAYLPRLVEAGASLVGGCCGTTPEHIRVLVQRARELTARPE